MTILTKSDKKLWAFCVWVLPLVCISVVLGIYELVTYLLKNGSLFPQIMPKNIPIILGFITSFSITMTGFIAAIGAYLLSISRTAAFNEWREEGYLSIFFHLYGSAIVYLILTFTLCILMVLLNMEMLWLKIILSSVILNLLHIAVITFIVINQANNGEMS